MDVERLAKELILKGMTPEQQKAVLDSIKATMSQAREVQKQRIGENVQVVVQALKKMEADIRSRYDEVGNKIEKRVATIKDGQDGRNGVNGKDGKDGRPGRDGGMGPRGADGLNGRDGRDGDDGVSVTDAHIDFDGSLIISLSSGRTINVGEVVAPDLAEKIKVITNGGGTSQQVLDTLASLQTQIDNLIPSQTGNAGKFLTTDGTDLAWADVAGGLDYQGTWNAATNTPALASGIGTNGHYYVVSADGSTNLDGTTDWKAGDWLIFNGTAWQKIDQSWAIAGANNNITSMIGLTGGISSPDFVQFDTTATPTQAVGRLQWDAGEGTLQFGLAGGNVNLQIGMENVAYVKSDDTVTLTEGMVVYISGANGTNLLAKRALASSDGLSATTLGVVTESIAVNGHGYVTTFGNVNGLNTSAFTAGQVLYLSPTTAGTLTSTKPVAPQHMVTIAVCTKVSAGDGQIFVRVDNGYELDELHNVLITSAASGNTLIYDAAAGVWKNANLTDGTGISITEGAGAITVTNTAPDQVVALTSSGTTTITGTYPNFNIASGDQYTGTVTSVGGTGTVNGLSLSGTVTSSGNLTLGGALSDVSLATQVTGTLPIANGGTGQTTANTAFNALAPSQTSNSGKYLTTDGTNSSWATIVSGASLSNDTTTATNLYPLFAAATSGTPTTVYTSNAQYLFKPSTGELSVKAPRASNGIVVNSATISSDYTIATGDNGMSAGPVSVDSGVTVTVSSGSVWTVV